MNPLENCLYNRLQALDEQGLRRTVTPIQAIDNSRIQVEQKHYLNLSGNDYLGIAGNSELIQAFYAGLEPENLQDRYGPGSGASRLMTGSHDQYRQLEESLARLYNRDRALVFNSGFQLNIGILPALTRKGDVVLADKFCHASLIDGMRLSAAKIVRYAHLDYEQLENLLKKYSRITQENKPVFIVTESIFSMDGDCADLELLVYLKEKYGAMLYVDEAHAVGVRGRQGLGLAEEQGVLERIDLLIGTFGKAWAGQGAFIVCNRTVCDFLINTVRSLIFTTGLPPVSIHWLNFILPKIQKMTAERHHLAALAAGLRKKLNEQGISTGGASQIVPVLIGGPVGAVIAAEQLRQQGFWVQAVRPPTVPVGTARLRLSVTAAMHQEQLLLLSKNIIKEI